MFANYRFLLFFYKADIVKSFMAVNTSAQAQQPHTWLHGCLLQQLHQNILKWLNGGHMPFRPIISPSETQWTLQNICFLLSDPVTRKLYPWALILSDGVAQLWQQASSRWNAPAETGNALGSGSGKGTNCDGTQSTHFHVCFHKSFDCAMPRTMLLFVDSFRGICKNRSKLCKDVLCKKQSILRENF